MARTAIFGSLLLGSALAQTLPQCVQSPSSSWPSLTIQFTPSMPTQTAPTSTVFGMIMTEYLNVVDCNYVMVENIDNNPPQVGAFTAKITIPVLTVYRVGCMPMTTAVTRRDYRGYDMIEAYPQTITPQQTGHKSDHHKRSEDVFESADARGFILDLASELSKGIDPTNENITVRDYGFLQEINTALFALNVVAAGFPLDQMCSLLHNDTIGNNLENASINRNQAADIICYAAKYGLYFAMSNDELLADLAALEYAIQMSAYATQTLREICDGLDYAAASFLGINTQGIRDYICNGTGGVTTLDYPSSSTQFVSTGTAYSAPTGTGSMKGTTIMPIVTVISGSGGQVLSSATSAAGSVAPWWSNSTVTQTEDATTVTVEPPETARTTKNRPVQSSPFYYPSPLRRRGHHE